MTRIMTRIPCSSQQPVIVAVLFLIVATTCCYIASATATTTMDNNEFETIMKLRPNDIEQRERYERMLYEHEVWRQTTWSGWFIRQLQYTGKQLAPFILWLSDILSGTYSTTSNDDSILSKLFYSIVLRSITISICIFIVVVILQALSKVFGKEITIIEEIIIEDDNNNDDNNHKKTTTTTINNNKKKQQRRKKKDN